MHITTKRTVCIGFILLALLLAGIAVYNYTKSNLLDKDKYKDFKKSLVELSEKVDSNNDIHAHITSWANSNNIVYTSDSADNIIIKRNNQSGNSARNMVICVEYNYKTFKNSIDAIASAEYISATDTTSSSTVIFSKNEENKHSGIRALDSGYFKDKSNVIYLDSADSSFISRQAFSSADSVISIPCSKTPRTRDTGIKLSISGIETAPPSAAISSQPNPLTSLGTILTHLKSKSVLYQLADVKVGNEGNMYPTSLEATILIDSYELEDFCTYLDDKSTSYVEQYSKKFPKISYSYNVMLDNSKLPGTTYSEQSVEILTNVLYTIKNGTYRFEEPDVPSGYNDNDVYAINCVEGLRIDGEYMNMNINSSAMNEAYLDQIVDETKTAAKISGASHKLTHRIGRFIAEPSELSKSINDANTIEARQTEFSPCSYIQEKNENINLLHVRECDDDDLRTTKSIVDFLNKGKKNKLLAIFD